MAKRRNAVNPRTGEVIYKTSNILVYGLSDEQIDFVYENLPNSNINVIDCSECFSDIIATSYIAAIINPNMLVKENIEYFNAFAKEVGAYSERIIFTLPHSILNGLNKNVKSVILQDEFEFFDKIRYLLLDASRSEKRVNNYSDTVSQTIRVLSEIRKHPYITTAELAEIIERNPRTVQRYITTLVCAGEFIEYDRKRKGWYLFENKSTLWGDY